jgi:flagellar assembly protein FliH
MRPPPKFLFDVDFGPRADVKAAERTITAEEHAARLAEAEAAGYRKGFADSEAQQIAEVERRYAAALESIGRALDGLGSGLGAIEARLEAEAVDVAVQVGRKLAGELTAREPLAELAALASECFRQLVSAPHVVVRVHDSLFDNARDRLEGLARARGYDGRLVVLGEPEIAPGDCRIEWADGGVLRDSAAIEAAIAESVKRYLAARKSADPIGRVQ